MPWHGLFWRRQHQHHHHHAGHHPKKFRLFRTVGRYSFFAAACFGAATLLPPKELLPAPLLYCRVIEEGIWRLLRCVYVGAGIAWDYKMNIEDIHSQQCWDDMHLKSAKALVRLAETNGGLYVKTGQGFAAMNHLLPLIYCRTMAKLQDAVLSRPFSEVVAVVEKDLGKRVDEVFDEFEMQPIASASLAQVHKATLKSSGQEVAVKVQYIDIAQRFHGDMGTISLMFKISGFLFPGFDFGAVVTKINDILAAELDFVEEAQNCDKCGQQMAQPFKGAVVTPTVHWQFTKKRVMVTDFIHGCKINDKKAIQDMGLSVKKAAELYISIFAYQIFHTGFIHADPHPGNIFVRRRPDSPREVQIVVLDHGLYCTMDSPSRERLANLWTAMVTHHDEDLKKYCAELNIEKYAIFASMMLQHPYAFFSPQKRRHSEKEFEAIRRQMHETMPEVNKIVTMLPKEYAMVLRNINTVRSVNKHLGTPVTRTAVMMKYSLPISHRDEFFLCMRLFIKLYWEEFVTTVMMMIAKWRYPELFEIANQEDMFTIG